MATAKVYLSDLWHLHFEQATAARWRDLSPREIARVQRTVAGVSASRIKQDATMRVGVWVTLTAAWAYALDIAIVELAPMDPLGWVCFSVGAAFALGLVLVLGLAGAYAATHDPYEANALSDWKEALRPLNKGDASFRETVELAKVPQIAAYRDRLVTQGRELLHADLLVMRKLKVAYENGLFEASAQERRNDF